MGEGCVTGSGPARAQRGGASLMGHAYVYVYKVAHKPVGASRRPVGVGQPEMKRRTPRARRSEAGADRGYCGRIWGKWGGGCRRHRPRQRPGHGRLSPHPHKSSHCAVPTHIWGRPFHRRQLSSAFSHREVTQPTVRPRGTTRQALHKWGVRWRRLSRAAPRRFPALAQARRRM